MKQTIFMLSILVACITGAVLTIYYIDTKCEKQNKTNFTLQPSEMTINNVDECGDTIKTNKGMVKIDTTNFKR